MLHDQCEGRTGPRQRLWKIRAARVVLATGAIERPLIFQNNDRPGVMLASAVRTYVRRFAASPGFLPAGISRCDLALTLLTEVA